MRKQVFRWRDAAAVWAGCLMMAGCSTMEPGTERACFSCDDRRLVRIVRLAHISGSDQGGRFRHPLNLTPAEWEATVRSVMVRSVHSPLLGPSYQGSTEPLFLEEEVRYLGASLQQAFQQVTAQEQVVFATARTTEEGPAQLTSGAWFVEAGRIHLRLANCRVAVTMPSIRRQIWKDPLFAQAGAFYEPVPGDHQELMAASRESRHPFRPDPFELAIAYGAMSGPLSPPAPVKRPGESLDSRSLEERLALLKRLREQGLITEEYRGKKQQLLDRL